MKLMGNGIAYPPKRGSRWRPATAAGALLLMAGTFSGIEMERWRTRKIHTVDDAYSIDETHPYEVRRKAIVAMQREGRTLKARLEKLAQDRDPRVALDARNALESMK